jgi:hypothetical protein
MKYKNQFDMPIAFISVNLDQHVGGEKRFRFRFFKTAFSWIVYYYTSKNRIIIKENLL